MFSRRKEEELRMILSLLCAFFGTLQVVAGTEFFDSSNYQLVPERHCKGEQNFKIHHCLEQGT